MRFCSALISLCVCLCAGVLSAQNVDIAEITRAQKSIEKLRQLVAAGAAPRAQLDRAEEQLADAQDAAYLRKTLYGQDLTDDQCDEMISAANRRLERRQKALEEGKKLVEAKVAPAQSLETFSEDIEGARKEVELAGSRAKLTHALAEMARLEETLETKLAQQPSEAPNIAERYDGDGVFSLATFSRVYAAFETRFGKQLPVSAMGETAVHRSLGFDHRGRVDVAVYPDTPEGIWLRDYLTKSHIPYFAFRQAVPGKATGAHIHIGPMSTRLKLGG
jgi:hypothetical protein